MTLRDARKEDIPRLLELLLQVHALHAEHRPDIFKKGQRKYNEKDLGEILEKESASVYVAADEDGRVCGYAFCMWETVEDHPSLCDRKSVCVDDICVDASYRGKGIGTLLYRHVTEEAKRRGVFCVTLNVWSFNESARRFYEKCGMVPLKTVMEQKIGEET